MVTKYVINEIVVFTPKNRELKSLLTGKSIKLNIPTSQLFEAFVTRVGVTITQNDLYTIAWGDNGVNVAPNTLYQNISLLRKALYDIGMSAESLTTIRGKGFIFTTLSVVEKNVDDIDAVEIKTPNKKILYFTLVTLVTSFMLFTYLFKNKIEEYPDEYMFTSSINECKIFISTKDVDNAHLNNITDFLEKKSLNCSEYPFLYIAYGDVHPTLSIMSCQHDIKGNKNNNCKTDIIYNYGGKK